MKISALLTYSCVALLGATTALAQTGLSQGEKQFLMTAGQGSIAEIQFGQLGEKNGSSPHVRQYAKRLVEDHSRVERQLQQIAAAHNISIPAEIPRKQERQIDTLEKLQGRDFDQAFTRHMFMDHQDDIREFREIAAQAQSREIKQFATNTLPTLEQHLQTAQQLNESLQ